MIQSSNRIARFGASTFLGIVSLALGACGMIPADEAAEIERNILATPGQEELWRTISQEYPAEFASLVSEIEAMNPGQRGNDVAIEQLGARWLQGFFEDISPDAVRAPPQQMLSWSEAEHDLYAALQQSAVSECARMTMGDWITIDPTNEVATAAIARRNSAMVRAASAGRQKPSEYAVPDEEALRELGSAIAATGLDPDLQSALGSTEDMEALSAEDQCTIGVAVFKGLTNLPDEAEPEMAAYMLAPE